MTPQKESGKEGLKILLMLASVIVITAGLQAGKPVLLPIVLSGFLAIVSYPLTTFFKGRLRFPHWLAVTFTVIMDFGILVGLAYLAQYLGQDLARTVTVKYQPLMMEKIHELRAFLIERDWNNLADQMLQELPDLLNGQRIVAFALNFIPTFGSIIAAIPPTLLAMLLISPTAGIIVAGGYLVINTVLGSCLEPMLLGRQFGIVTSMVLLSVIFWGWVWGPIGMLLAVPITMLIKLGLESSKDLAWIAQLIDNPPTPRFPLPPLHSGKTNESTTKE